MRPDALVVYIMRHDLRCAFNLIVRATVESMRMLSPDSAVEEHDVLQLVGTFLQLQSPRLIPPPPTSLYRQSS